jgi:thioredoxin-like negative regulator of GroEL
MQVRTVLLIPLIAFAVGCTPRQPPAPRPTIFIPATPVDDRAASMERARVSWEEGVTLGRQARWAEASEAYRRAAELDPGEVRYHMALADALLQGGREWESADALMAGIRAEEAKTNPNHRVLGVDYERLIRLLTRLNRLDEARTARARQEHHRRLRDAAPPRE